MAALLDRRKRLKKRLFFLRSMRNQRPTTSPVQSSRRYVVPSKAKPLTETQIRAHEANRDLAAELLESVRQMKAGKTTVVLSPAIEARERTGLSQSQFASLLGVSVRTLQGWEQGRKQPSGAARTLLTIARTNPKALLAVAGK
jgi:putative transcriptional regulator